MQQVICWGFGGPDDFEEKKKQTEPTTPDADTLTIMRAHEVPDEAKMIVYSEWDSMSSEEQEAMLAARNEIQRQPWEPPGGPGLGYESRREPISGAPYDSRRVYTRNEGEQWRFWGIQEDEMTINQFWAIHDPENTRGAEQPWEPEPPYELVDPDDFPEITSRVRRPAHRRRVLAEPQTPRQTSESEPHRAIGRSRVSTSFTQRSPRRSLKSVHSAISQGPSTHLQSTSAVPFGSATHETSDSNAFEPKDSMPVERELHSDYTTGTPRKRGRGRPRKITPLPAKNQANDAHEQAQVHDPVSVLKRPRGRPPKNQIGVSAKQTRNRQTTVVLDGNTRIAKPRTKGKLPMAPSTHSMQTRARGSAQLLRLP